MLPSHWTKTNFKHKQITCIMNDLKLLYLSPCFFSVSVESTGILAPEVLVSQAIQVLMAKCRDVIRELDDKTV